VSRVRLVPAVAAVLVAVAVWQTPAMLRSSLAVAREGAHSSRTERELLPGHVVGIEDVSIFPRLAALIPAHSTYTVVTSQDLPQAEFAGGEAQAFADYWLLPRRFVPQNGPHDFEIVYGKAPPGAPVVADFGNGVELVRG
jgi:hypothetical protein